MYTSIDFKSKKAFKEAVAKGDKITLFAPGIGSPPTNGKCSVEGPQYPKPHTWYATVEVKDGIVIKVK